MALPFRMRCETCSRVSIRTARYRRSDVVTVVVKRAAAVWNMDFKRGVVAVSGNIMKLDAQ